MPVHASTFGRLCVVVALAASGCTRESPLGPVSGSVTVDGVPVTAGVVTFVAADRSNSASGELTRAGTYSMPDAPTGDVQVSVRTKDFSVILGPSAPQQPGKGSESVRPPGRKNPLYVPTLERYEDFTKSGLRFAIPKEVQGPFVCDIALTK